MGHLTYITYIHYIVVMQNQSLNRTQIYLTVEQQNTLAEMAHAQQSSSSALIRDAIDGYIAQHQPTSKLMRRKLAAGGWQPNADAPSLRQLRKEERSF